MTRLRALASSNAANAPAPFGLVSPATLVEITSEADEHWINGFAYDLDLCSINANVTDICDDTNTISSISSASSACSALDYFPFAVEVIDTSSTFGFKGKDAVERVNYKLALTEQKVIEREFWSGELNAGSSQTPNRHLASEDAIDVTPSPSTAIKIRYGVALLEGALASSGHGGIGTLHMTREIASTLSEELEVIDGALYTKLGNMVIAGSGYPGTGPGGSVPAAGKSWIYATGPVSVRLSDVIHVPDFTSQAVDTLVNTQEFRAERAAAVTWDTCAHYGVLVDLSLTYE